jgi:hypothetical protein
VRDVYIDNQHKYHNDRYRKAAMQRHVNACWNLSSIYSRGKGTVAPDVYQSIRWMKHAATCGADDAPARLTCLNCKCRYMPLVMDVKFPPPITTIPRLPSLSLPSSLINGCEYGITIHELIMWRRLVVRFGSHGTFDGEVDDRTWCTVPDITDGGINDEPPDEPLLTTLEVLYLGIIMSEYLDVLRRQPYTFRIHRPLYITLYNMPLSVLAHCWHSNVLPLPQAVFVTVLSYLTEVYNLSTSGDMWISVIFNMIW